jgi:glucose/arabinose dehydrogenase
MVKILTVIGFLMISSCSCIRNLIVDQASSQPDPKKPSTELSQVSNDKGTEGKPTKISLKFIASGFTQPTEMQFIPGHESIAVVLEKTGEARWLDIRDGKSGVFFSVDVVSSSEMGLLGIAFDPQFYKNGWFYVSHNLLKDGKKISRISKWRSKRPTQPKISKQESIGTVLEQIQPYGNHNGGQIQFGPDGLLYIAFGDGGWADDPHKHGQNSDSFLGSILRVDLHARNKGSKKYGLPASNPIIRKRRSEVFAYGLRNPWKFTFDQNNRLIVADVGQNLWEEVSIVNAGDNMGWNRLEGAHCFEPKKNCEAGSFTPPFIEYDRSEGGSITGGYIYKGGRKDLLNLYIFGDYVSGRIWAAKIPRDPKSMVPRNQWLDLGHWPLNISTFGRSSNGSVFVVGMTAGAIYEIL